MEKIVHQLKSLIPTDLSQAETNIEYEQEPWNNVHTKVNISLSKKGNNQNQELKLKTKALEIINSQYHQHTKIFTDGSKITQPNKTTASLVIPELNVQVGRRIPDFCSIYTDEF